MHRTWLILGLLVLLAVLSTGPARAQIDVSAELGYIEDDQWVPLSGAASGAVLIRVIVSPPPSTNGDVTLEIHGSASWIGPPPNGCGTAEFFRLLGPTAENVTVDSVTSTSELAWLSMVAFTPDDPDHTISAAYGDAPDPHWEISDRGTVVVSLLSVGPDGPSSVAQMWVEQNVDMSQGYVKEVEHSAGRGAPVVYAATAGAAQADPDGHSWLSPYFSVGDVTLSRQWLTGTRKMTLLLWHGNTSTDNGPASTLGAWTYSTAPLGCVGEEELDVEPGVYWKHLTNDAPMEAAGTYWVLLGGLDGHGDVSKYAGDVEHYIPPALVSFSIPSAACVAGESNEDEETWGLALDCAQDQWPMLGHVDAPEGVSTSEACFYSNRFVYGRGFRGGVVEMPDKAHMLELLFADDVVIYNGHGSQDLIQNQLPPESVTSTSIANYATAHGQSQAKLVLLHTCLAGVGVAPALQAAGVDCVIGFLDEVYLSSQGWQRLLEYMCDEGKTAAQAYSLVCQEFDDWGIGKTILRGSTSLWGVPL